MITAIALREFRSLFAMPSTWMILGVLQFIFSWFFLARVDAFLEVQSQLAQIANAPGATLAVVTPLFGTAALIMMMLVPVITMRMLAEEKRNLTLALLMSSPVSDFQIVMGKFAGLLLFLLLIITGCTLMTSSLAAGTYLDTGLLFSNALGLFLLASCYASLGLFISSLTSHPLVAAITSMALLFGLWLLEFSTLDNAYALHALAPTSHFTNFNVGLVSSTDLVFFLLFSSAFLALTVRRVRNSRSDS